MKNVNSFMYKYRVLLNFIPIVIGIMAFIMSDEKNFSKNNLLIATIVLLISLCLRFWVAIYNWENINSEEPIAENGLITNGPYSYCRNPMYLSAIIMVIGFSVIFNSILITILMVVPTVLLHLQQIWYEEKYLIEILSNEGQYQNYLKTVPALIPYKGKVGGIPRQGKANWKRGLQRDIGPVAGLFIFIVLSWIVLILFKFDFHSLATICILTVVIDAILVMQIQKKKVKREPFLQLPQ